MRQRRYPRIAVLCVLLIALTACIKNPDPELQLTPSQEATVVYNNVTKAYVSYYNKQPAEAQAKLKEDIGRLVLDADAILTKWKKAEEEGKDALESVELWATVLVKLLDALDRYDIKIGD